MTAEGLIMSKSLVSELSRDAMSGKIVPAFSTAVIAAILFVIFQISFAAMVYSGSLSSLATHGASLTLSGGFLICLFAALTSSCKSTISFPQDAPAAVLSTIALTISAALGEQTSMDIKFMTVAAAISLSALLTGAAFIIIGRLRLANMLRFIPFPVVGGFLAGTGWLLVVGGMAVMCGIPVSLETLSRLASSDMILKWLPGVAYCVALFVVTLRYSHFLIMPGSLVAGVALFYLAFTLYDVSPDAARAAGILVSGVPADGLWPPFTINDLAFIDWPLVWQQVPAMFSVVLITVIGMLLNVSGIELALGEEIDMNREFVSGGAGNCLIGLGGCLPGYPSISLSLLGLKTGARSRLTGLITGLILGGVLFFGGRLLEYFPKALLGGMLMLLGFSLIHEWIFQSRKRLPLPDYLILCSIFLVVGLVGFMEGVAVGLIAAVIFFVIRFSKVPVIRSEFSALDRKSIKDRPVPHRKLLSIAGERIRGYELTGYIFFGSATALMDSLKSALTSQPHPDFILLDFAHVSGFDISAVNNFQRFALNADAANTAIVITAAPERFTEALRRNLSQRAMERLVFFQDLDHGLDWCEDRLIERALSGGEDEASMRDELFHHSVDDFMAHLEQQERFEHLVERISPWVERRESPTGSIILNKGEQSPGLYLLTHGMATEIDPESGARVRSLKPGSIITAAAAFDIYTAPAAIRADSDCELAFLSAEARSQLEREDPSLAIALHGYLIRCCCR
jgi:SulP family sulfate permease